MPIAALCANISWEFIFTFLRPHDPPQSYVDLAWFTLDVVILYQALRFGPRSFPGERRGAFYAGLGLGLAVAFGAVLLVTVEFDDAEGKYTAFGQNLMMSILFVAMLLRRDSLDGQSPCIAVLKMLGTFAASVGMFGYDPPSPLLGFLCTAILVFDLIYIGLVVAKCHELGIRPWRRL